MTDRQITVTYLHMSEDAEGASLGSYKSRRRALLQYLFECTCPKCLKEKPQPGEDSSDDDY
jgi:hypothetical protein